ncbi:hypothetical protein ACO2Q1_14160 [Brevundimonas sp. VNH65]|uniref:hypothetical protein n=1 Tax=Brevundimonas sp. VNH65 TaxID=3400917 RepID=UPI003C037FA4
MATETEPDGVDLSAELAALRDDLKSIREEAAALMNDADYDGLIGSLEEFIPEGDRVSLPSTGSKRDQVYARIVAALKASQRPVVPPTASKRPPLSPPAEDIFALPAHARIARGYASA